MAFLISHIDVRAAEVPLNLQDAYIGVIITIQVTHCSALGTK